MSEVFQNIYLYAYLNGAWTDIYSDVKSGSLSAKWGIFGNGPNDIISDIGQITFTLINNTGQYYPDGASPLSGWASGIPVKLVFQYDGITYTRFKGYIDKDSIRLNVGRVTNEDTVTVNAPDWMKFATKNPIRPADVQESVTADVAIQAVLDLMGNPINFSGDVGNYTFPTVFDNTNITTTAYNEFAKIAFSESPGRIYLQKNRDTGEALVFENSSHRGTADAQKYTYSLTYDYWLTHSNNNFKSHSGAGVIYKRHNVTTAGTTVVTLDDTDHVPAALGLVYGGEIINYVTVTAQPKRSDDEVQILYRLPYSMPIAAGQTINYRAPYVDPTGGGRKVNAIVSSMRTPDVPGGIDGKLMTLLNFSYDTINDETGRHSWAQNDVEVWNDVYTDGSGDARIMGGPLGDYGVFGGYANYLLTTQDSDDFNFGSGAFTIGWYENRQDPTANDTSIVRNTAGSFEPYILGYSDGNFLYVYMSSDGATWDIANGEALGQISVGRWVYYEVSRDSDGWFYAFADGKRTAKWYSASAIPDGAGTFTIGRRGAAYTYMGFDSFFVRKGECLHTTDFDPPRRNINPTFDGDYLMNAAEDGTSTDLSSSLAITATYKPEAVEYTLTNNSGTAAFITHLQARGRGVYSYDPIEDTVQDSTSQGSYGYQQLRINQPYQSNLAAGTAWADNIITDYKDEDTDVQSISFWANLNQTSMFRFLQCDIGDLIGINLSDYNIDICRRIQSVNFTLAPGQLVFVTWGLVKGNLPPVPIHKD